MTKVETDNFITEVLQGLWSNWKPKDIEFGLWAERLRYYDYTLARQAVRNWFVQQTKSTARPPMGAILNICRATLSNTARRNEPVLLYEIFQESNLLNKQKFFRESQNKLPHMAQAVEAEAERNRRAMAELYGGGNYIINRVWEKHYDTQGKRFDDFGN